MFQSGRPTGRDDASLDLLQEELPHPRLPAWGQLASAWLTIPDLPSPHLCPGRLTNSRPPGRPDLPTTSAQTSSLKAVWMGLCTFKPWLPGLGFSLGLASDLSLAKIILFAPLFTVCLLPLECNLPRGQGLYLPCALP